MEQDFLDLRQVAEDCAKNPDKFNHIILPDGSSFIMASHHIIADAFNIAINEAGSTLFKTMVVHTYKLSEMESPSQ